MSKRVWSLAVQTGSGNGAGTNADTFVILFGSEGKSPAADLCWVLDNPGNDMEQGDLDSYRIPFEPVIGEPQKIWLWFNPAGQTDSPNWICDYMLLVWLDVDDDGQVTGIGDTYRFDVNREFVSQGWYEIRRTGIQRLFGSPALVNARSFGNIPDPAKSHVTRIDPSAIQDAGRSSTQG